MKFLDTFEASSKIIKLTVDENDYSLWIHDKYTNNLEVVKLNKKELVDLADFIYNFLDMKLDKG